jgi:hypothetical protein
MRHNPIRPDPGELRQVAGLAQAVAEDLDHVVAAVKSVGVVVDAEVYQAAAAIRSWAAWLAAKAAPKDST